MLGGYSQNVAGALLKTLSRQNICFPLDPLFFFFLICFHIRFYKKETVCEFSVFPLGMGWDRWVGNRNKEKMRTVSPYLCLNLLDLLLAVVPYQ